MSGERGDAFARLYDDHVWDVYGFFGYRLDSRQQAEDLTQQTFERALRAWDRYDGTRGSERTWLMAIARNLLVDHFRADRSRRHEPLSVVSEDSLGHEVPDERGLGVSPELEQALGRLSERERELIALRFGGDLPAREIAELMGLSLDNVQQILSRSLRRLRSELEQRGPAEGLGASTR